MISEETLEELKCASSDQEHFAIEPISLHNCGHSVCKKCVLKDDLKEIKCKLCGFVSKQDLNEIQVSRAAQKLLKIYLEDIFQILKEGTSSNLNELKGMLKIKWFKWNNFRFIYFLENVQLKNEFLEVKFNYIREEIDIRIESLVNQVHEMGDRLREKVKEMEKEASKSVN